MGTTQRWVGTVGRKRWALVVLGALLVGGIDAGARDGRAAAAGGEPQAVAPRQVFPPRGTTIPQRSTGVLYERTTWHLKNAGSNGFSHYVLEQFNTYANTWSTAYYGPGPVYEALLPAVQFTEFRVTPFDGGGQPGPTTAGQGFTPIIADETDPSPGYSTAVKFSKGWRRVRAATAYGGSYLRSATVGAWFRYCGYFSRIALVAPRSHGGGRARVTAFGATHSLSFGSTGHRYREVVGQWGTPATPDTPAGSGPTYCLKVSAKSTAPIFIDAVEYNVPDVIE